jgi:hypothetical protein
MSNGKSTLQTFVRVLAGLGLAGLLVPGTSGAAAAAAAPDESVLPLHDGRDCYGPAAAFGGDQFLVAWQSGRLAPGDLRDGPVFNGDVVACRVDKAGKPVDAAPFVVCGAKDLQECPRVAAGVSGFLVVWQDMRNGKDYDVCAARVGADGKVLDPGGILVCAEPHNQAQPAVVWDGKAFVVAWADARSGAAYEIYAARVSPDGTLLDPMGIRASSGAPAGHRFSPAIASRGGGRSLVLWNASKLAGFGFVPWSGAVLLEDGRPEETYLMKAQANDAPGPRGRANPMCLAAGPGGFFAAWTTATNLGRAGGAFASNCATFDEAGKRTVDAMAVTKDRRLLVAPSAAWDGTSFVVAWHERLREGNGVTFDALRATRLGADGQPGAAVLDLAGGATAPARAASVASDGAGVTLIAYEKHPDHPETPIRVAVRVLSAK